MSFKIVRVSGRMREMKADLRMREMRKTENHKRKEICLAASP